MIWIPEVAHFALILAFFFSVALAAVAWFERAGSAVAHLAVARLIFLSNIVLFFVACAFFGLAIAFLTDDFSVALVASHSHSQLPAFYKFSAVWGNHEGSLLLWILTLAAWCRFVAGSGTPRPIGPGAVAILAALLAAFIGFSLFVSNPFARLLLLSPVEGADLNPLLQDPAMVLHPPLLYIGYVGFAAPFALAFSALLHAGPQARCWVRYARSPALIAWAFLSIGIVLGSWWAYYELGWGGWWFWDPVENASFMPWLAGAALLHSLQAAVHRGQFQAWAALLAILCFGFSLIGMFLVRSGVLVSVHSFAADPARGLYLLLLLLIVMGTALVLFRLRAPVFATPPAFAWLSRESALLFNNLLLMSACLVVLLGTLFPLAMQALGQGLYSVGPPYFNLVFTPLLLCLTAGMAVAPSLPWKSAQPLPLLKRFAGALILSIAIGMLLPWLLEGKFHWGAALGVTALSWLVCGVLLSVRRGKFSMTLAHLGFALCGFGICLSSAYGFSRDLHLVPDASPIVAGGGYSLRLLGEQPLQGPNYQGSRLHVQLLREGHPDIALYPEKRYYPVRDIQLSEAAIDASLRRDLYLVAGDRLSDKAWTVRFQYKPFIRCIWFGGGLMALGGLWGAFARRRK